MRLFSFAWRRHVSKPAICCFFAASMWSVDGMCDGLPSFQKRPAEASSSNWDVEKTTERNVRLNYVSTPWSKVLNDLALKSGSTLVLHDIPPGKFSRRDWSQHTRQDAIRILNRDLEPKGFRIHVKDQFLTVMQSRRSRPEYQRPLAPQVEPQPRQIQETTQSVPPKPIGQWVSPPKEEPVKIQPPSRKYLQGTSLLQLAAFEKEEKQPVDQPTTLAVSPQNRSSLDIAKQIHKAFKRRSRLENSGPNGHPAFIVEHTKEGEKAGEVQFSMEIDTTNNRLLITAEKKVQNGLKALIEQIDVNPLGGSAVPTLVAGNGSTAEIGKQLRRPLKYITQARQKITSGKSTPPQGNTLLGDQAPGLAQVDAQALPEPQQPTPGANPVTDDISSDLVGNLKGDVSIEALDDLDLLILRGNTTDVESVLQVIQKIEQLALGSLPEIHLLKLQHVDSQSLAQLLTDVYEQLSELRSDNAQQNAATVNVIPVVTPNAILILAPGNTMETILDLADNLDQPVDPSHEVEVFRLKHAVADNVVELLEGFYDEEEENRGLRTRLKVAADSRTNSIIVQARPRDLSEISAVIKKIDADEAASTNQMKIYKLKNALADELAEFLNSAIQSVADPRASTVGQSQTGQTQTQNQTDPKSVVLEFLTEDGEQLARSGLLSDIRFNAETRTNSLAVTAPAQSLPLIEELIRILDQPSSAVADVKYFKLQHADALDAVDMLNDLFTEDDTSNDDEGSLGVQLIGATDTSSSLLPLKFVADPRTNSVIATGGADALIIVENLLYRLDATDPRTRITSVIKLHNAPATDVAEAVNVFLQSQRELATIDPDRISTSQLLEQEVIVTPEPISNNLLISATPAYFEEIEALAKELDAAPPQVIIQALLVEVLLDNTDEFGVEIGFQDPILFDRSILDNLLTVQETIFDNQGNPTSTFTRVVSQEASPGFNWNNQPLGNNNGPASFPGHVGSQGLSNFALNRTNDDLGFGGLVLSASSDSVNVLIRALAARRSVRILSRPQIRALDNQLAQIQVGQEVPVTEGVTTTLNAISPIVDREPSGIILTVTPRISPEGDIVMELVAEKSKFILDEGVPIYTDIATGSVVTAPVKDIATVQTTVKVPDGQTIVVGGMISESDEVLERKVPWLGDLPLIGHAFRFDSQTSERTELLVFLTPRVLHGDADSEHIKEVESGRLHYFQEDAEEMHGPLFGVPNPIYEQQDGTPIDLSPGETLVPGSIAPAPPAPEPPALDSGTSNNNSGISRLSPIQQAGNEQ